MDTTDPPIKPSLRISNIVYGRKTVNRRVTYLVGPPRPKNERAIPEQVVLARWRMRTSKTLSFSGTRLSPTLWRALPVVLGTDFKTWPAYDVPEIQRLKKRKANDLRKNRLKIPGAEIVHALIAVCRPESLSKLVDRHKTWGPSRRSGVPDLFLFARDGKKRACRACFVEVKKPEERLLSSQRDEIIFMKDCSLNAGVLRLIERR